MYIVISFAKGILYRILYREAYCNRLVINDYVASLILYRFFVLTILLLLCQWPSFAYSQLPNNSLPPNLYSSPIPIAAISAAITAAISGLLAAIYKAKKDGELKAQD